MLDVNNPDALGVFRSGADITAQGGTLVDSGAALQMQTDLEGEPIVLNGDGVAPGLNGHNSGACATSAATTPIPAPSPSPPTRPSASTAARRLTIGTSPTLIGTGTIAGSSNLTKELTGTLVLADDDSAFTGGTTVNQGALRLEHSGALGTGVTGRESAMEARFSCARQPPAPMPTSRSS